MSVCHIAQIVYAVVGLIHAAWMIFFGRKHIRDASDLFACLAITIVIATLWFALFVNAVIGGYKAMHKRFMKDLEA